MPSNDNPTSLEEVREEIKNRRLVALHAYAYEVECNALIDDLSFDALALNIKPHINTGNPRSDEFFRTQYEAYTGSWIFDYPFYEECERHYDAIIAGTATAENNSHSIEETLMIALANVKEAIERTAECTLWYDGSQSICDYIENTLTLTNDQLRMDL